MFEATNHLALASGALPGLQPKPPVTRCKNSFPNDGPVENKSHQVFIAAWVHCPLDGISLSHVEVTNREGKSQRHILRCFSTLIGGENSSHELSDWPSKGNVCNSLSKEREEGKPFRAPKKNKTRLITSQVGSKALPAEPFQTRCEGVKFKYVITIWLQSYYSFALGWKSLHKFEHIWYIEP